MPQLGETVAEGKFLSWFKTVGDEVKEGDNLFEVETDKVTLEVPVDRHRPSQSKFALGLGVVAKVGEIVAVIGGAAAAIAPEPMDAPAARNQSARTLTL